MLHASYFMLHASCWDFLLIEFGSCFWNFEVVIGHSVYSEVEVEFELELRAESCSQLSFHACSTVGRCKASFFLQTYKSSYVPMGIVGSRDPFDRL